jgi:uncharacterized membrane protein YfhO
MMSAPDMDLRETGVTLEPLPFELPGTRPDGAAVTDFTIESPEHIIMRVSTPENALLTIAIPNYPGWRATINGRGLPIYDNYAGLIGIPVAAGEDLYVELRFLPDSLVSGAELSGLALLAAIGLAAFELRRTRRRSAAPVDEEN